MDCGSIFQLDRHGLIAELHQEPIFEKNLASRKAKHTSQVASESLRKKLLNALFAMAPQGSCIRISGRALSQQQHLVAGLEVVFYRYIAAAPFLLAALLMETILARLHAMGPSCIPPVVKVDNYQSDYQRNNNPDRSLEVSVQDPNVRRGVIQLQRVLNEWRLFRLIRRFQENVRRRVERRCELREFVVLRMQFLVRSRSRLRAVIRIQRFVRDRNCTGVESTRPSTV